MNLKSLKKKRALSAWILAGFLLFPGCGSSSSNVFTAGTQQSASDTAVDFQMPRAAVPDGVSEVRLIGLDAVGDRLWDVSVPLSDSVRVPSIPPETSDVVVQYLANRRTVALSLVAVPGSAPEVRSQTVSVPQVSSLAQAITQARLNNTDVEIPAETIVLLKIQATLANGKSLEFGKDAVWLSSNPEIATVENGLVRGLAEGETSIIARLGNVKLETPLTVTPEVPERDLQDFFLGNDAQPNHTIDLSTGLLDGGLVLPGWNQKNRTMLVKDFGVRCGPGQVKVVGGDDWVVSAKRQLSVDGDLVPSSPGKTIDCYFYGGESVGVGSFSLMGYQGDNLSADPSRPGYSGGNLTLVGGGSASVSELILEGSGSGSRGGDLRIDCDGSVSCTGHEALGGTGYEYAPYGFVGFPGDVLIRGQSVSLRSIDVNGSESFFHGGPGSPGGRITILSRDGITLDNNGRLDASGGNGAPAGAARDGEGGRGGEVSLISLAGEIDSAGEISTKGGQAFGAKKGGDGGTIRGFAPGAFSFTSASAEGGSSVAGPGGAGGRVVLTSGGSDIDVSGGQGTPSGAEGFLTILGTALAIAPGSHEFDTTTGIFDDEYSLPGWDPITNTLTVSQLTVDEGATFTIVGQGLFRCVSDEIAQVMGTLSYPGSSAGSPDVPTHGGALYLSSNSSVEVGTHGQVLSKGGDSDEAAADGGIIQLLAPLLDVSGKIASPGGRSSNDLSGGGGDIFLNVLGAFTLSGQLDSSGQTGFNAAGDGGRISVITGGDFQATGSLLCAGGEAAIRGAAGGTVRLSVGGQASLFAVNCSGSDSGIAPGQGGSFDLLALGDILLNGAISTNAGESNQNRPGNGGTVNVNGEQTVTIPSTGSVSANGNRRGQGGQVTIHGDLGVTRDGPVTANPGGTVTITP